MKWIFMFLYISVSHVSTPWHNDIETAKQEARTSNRLILLNFSGSDWCGPCMRLKAEVFNSESFSRLADSSLVLCNADFPRSRKNQLPKAQQQRNDALAETYNPSGKFPYTVLLNADGKLLNSWDGYPQGNRQLFIDQLKAAADAHRP